MKTIDLQGKWRLRNRKGTWDVPAQIPGDTHSALLAAKQIPDPFWGTNEVALQALHREDWIYEREFHLPAGWLAEKLVFLELEGVDTVAEIFLNGKALARTANAFVRFRFDVKSLLRSGKM
jgi:beta-mannosidase